MCRYPGIKSERHYFTIFTQVVFYLSELNSHGDGGSKACKAWQNHKRNSRLLECIQSSDRLPQEEYSEENRDNKQKRQPQNPPIMHPIIVAKTSYSANKNLLLTLDAPVVLCSCIFEISLDLMCSIGKSILATAEPTL